jgi:hypothetical protein
MIEIIFVGLAIHDFMLLYLTIRFKYDSSKVKITQIVINYF